MHHTSSGKVKAVQWMLVASLSGLPVAAYAMGLGKLVVRSGLDEPLIGEIELISPTSQELNTLKSSLASRSDFDSAGIERLQFLNSIKYKLVRNRDGRSVIELSTDEPIREPFLHLLLQVEWSGGRLVREYTALLDPPQWTSVQPTPVQAPEVPSVSEVPVAETVPAAEPVPATEAEVWQPVAPAAGLAVSGAAESEPAASTEEPPAPSQQPADSIPGEALAASPVTPESAQQPVAPSEVAQTESTVEERAATIASEPSDMGFVPQGSVRAWASAWEYGPVRKGDTLSKIAGKLRADKSLSPQQVMLALQRVNPSAFYGGNINNLKAGVILRVPERDEVEATPKKMAAREFRAQYAAWQSYKLKLASASQTVTVPSAADDADDVAVAATKAQEPAGKPASGKPAGKPATAAKERTPTPPVKAADGGANEELLKIVRSNLEDTATDGAKAPGVATTKGAAKEQRALTDKVATLEEAIESKQMQNKEMRDRVGKMQEQVKNTSRLIDLENKELAQAQKQATESAKAPSPAPVTAPAAPVKPAEAPVAVAPPVAATPPVTEAAPKPAAPKAATPRPVAPPPGPTAATEEAGFLQTLMDNVIDNPLLLTVLAGIGVLGGGVAGIHYLRRRRAAAEFEESILSGGSLTSESASMSESGSQAPSDTSFLSDFSQGGMGNIHTDEVDPIAEAEVYLAYGRDEQAEEILKEAIVKDPARQELKHKLLEIYHQRNDVSAFETLAEELYAALEGKGGKVWEKVEEMGRKISPGNPMFSGGAKPASVATSKGSAFAMDADTVEPVAPVRDQGSVKFEMSDMLRGEPAAPEASAASSGGGLDFDLGSSREAPPASTSEVSFDLDLASPDEMPAADEYEPQPDKGSGMSGMDFNINDAAAGNEIQFDTPVSGDNEVSLDFEEATTAGTSDEDLSFALDSSVTDSPALEFEAVADSGDTAVAEEESQWDETATKLDLAKAYIDMGDAEGARSILDEVLAEGNESQKEQARDLASQIA